MLTNDCAQAQGKTAADAVDPTIFDRTHLRQYTGGDEALERELVGLFLGQFAPARAQLDDTASAEDWKFAAHSLKGSARSIGAPQIADLAEELETLGQNETARARAEVLAQLDEALAAFAGEAEKLFV